jgi:hypothetical protein
VTGKDHPMWDVAWDGCGSEVSEIWPQDPIELTWLTVERSGTAGSLFDGWEPDPAAGWLPHGQE